MAHISASRRRAVCATIWLQLCFILQIYCPGMSALIIVEGVCHHFFSGGKGKEKKSERKISIKPMCLHSVEQDQLLFNNTKHNAVMILSYEHVKCR